MCAVMKTGEVKVFTKRHLPQKSELLHYFRVKDGGESVSQAWDVKSSLPYKSNRRLPCGSHSLLLVLLVLWHADPSRPYFSSFPFSNDNIKCAALNNPKDRDPSWWTSGHSAPTHTLLSLEGNVFFWNEFTPWWVDHIFWQVALLTFLECLWRIRPLVMGRSTNTALLLCLMGSILSSQSSMTSLWTFSLDTTLPCLWRRTWVQSRPWALQRWVSKQNFPQGFDNSN